MTLRDVKSVYVAFGGFVMLAVVFFVERAAFGRCKARAVEMRESRGRFDSAPEATF